MSKLSLKKVLIAILALGISASVVANDEVRKLNANPNYWAFPGGDYNNWRYTELNQINTKNASKLVTAWTFSTGRLQGHEGGPLVLPGSATEKPSQGEVISVGPGKKSENGDVSPVGVAVGDIVIFGQYGGNEIKIDGDEYLILSESDIFGVVS